MFAALCLGLNSPRAGAASWTTTTSLPDAFQGHALVYSSNRLFHTGGISLSMGIPDGTKVFSASASDAGAVGAWVPAMPLPEAVFYHAGATVNSHLYVLGGFHYTDAGGMVVSNVVYRAKIGAEGAAIGAWETATPLPEPVFFPSAAVWNGRIYVTGGWNGAALVNKVYSAEAREDGSLGPWVAQKSLPEAVYTHAAVSNGTLYVLGGTVNGGNDIQNSVYFAKINADGTLAEWAATASLPEPVSNHGAVVANGKVLVFGGWTGAAPTAAVQSSLIESAGGLGAWSAEASLPRPLYLLATAASPSHVFVSGGIDSESMRDAVYSMPLPAAPAPPPPPVPTDALPPRTTLAFGSPFHGGAPFISPQTPAALTAVDDALQVGDAAGVGVASTQWAVDDGAFAVYAAPIRVAADGAHWFRFRSVDALGHAEEVRASSAVVDGTPPASSLSVGSPRAVLATGELIVGPATPLAVSAADPVVNGAASGVARTFAGVDGGELALSEASFVLPAVDGAHSVRTSADDNVGNVEAAHAATVYRDATAPQTSLALSSPAFTPSAGGTPFVGAGTLLSFTAQDPLDSGGVAAGISQTEYSLDGSTAALYTGSFGLAEGARSLAYRSVDNVGNSEIWRSAAYRSDATLPQSSLTWDGAPRAPTPETALLISALDPESNGVASGVGHILYSVDGGLDQAFTIPFRLALGSHTVAYAAYDNAGNAEERRSATVVVVAADDLPPRTTLTFGDPRFGSAPFISPATPATLAAVDDAKTVGDGTGAGVASTRWALDDGAFADYTSPIRIAADGVHWLRFLSVDAAGRAEAVRASSAAVDGTAPASTLSVGSPQAVLASGEVIVGPGTELAVSAVDPAVGGVAAGVASIRAGVDGAALAPVSAPFLLPAVDGAHSVLLQAADNLGNTESAHAATVYRDGAPPVTTLAFSAAPFASPTGPIYGAGLALSFTAVDPVSGGVAAGVHHTEYALDGGDATTYAGPFGAAEGARTLSYRSLDGVGNAEASRAAAFQVDATPPLSTLSVEGGTTLFGQDISAAGSAVSLSAADPLSSGVASGVGRIVYSVDGGAEREYAAPFPLVEGRHTVSYGAIDRAGNAEERRSLTLSPGTFLTVALTGLESVVLSGKAKVTGDVAGLTVTLNGQSSVTGTISRGQAAAAAPAYDLDAARAWAQAHNDNAALPAGALSAGALTMTGGSLEFPAGDYYLTGLHLSGQARLSVSGRVNIFLHGPLTVSGGAEFNTAGEADGLWLISDAGDASLSGNSRSAFNLFAPRSGVSIAGDGQFAGRVLGKTAAVSGKALQPSTTALPPSTHAPKAAVTHPPLAAHGGNGTAGGGHAAGRDKAVASSRLDSASPSVAARGSSAPPAPAPSGSAPEPADNSRPDAPRPPKHLSPAAAPSTGAGTAGPGRSAGRESAVAFKVLTRQEPVREKGGAVQPPLPGLATSAPNDRPASARPTRVKSSMPALALSARAAFATVGRGGSAVRAKDRTAVVIPDGAATAGLGVTVSPPRKSDLLENRRQADVESRKGLVAAAVGAQYGPEGTQFAKPVTLELPYERASLPRGVSESGLAVHYWNPVAGDWEKLESSVDAQNQIVRAQTTHFSLYQIFGGGSPASAPTMPNDPAFAAHAAYAFPNPSRHSAPVVFRLQPGLADSVTVRVYDLSGRLVHESSNFQNRGGFDDGNGFGSQFTFDHAWDVGGIGSGVYNFVITGHKAGASNISASGKVGVIK